MDRLIAVVRAANHGVLAGSIRGVANLDGGMMEVDRVCFLEFVLGLSRCLVLVMVLANGDTDAWLMHRRMSTASVASGIGKMLWCASPADGSGSYVVRSLYPRYIALVMIRVWTGSTATCCDTSQDIL